MCIRVFLSIGFMMCVQKFINFDRQFSVSHSRIDNVMVLQRKNCSLIRTKINPNKRGGQTSVFDSNQMDVWNKEKKVVQILDEQRKNEKINQQILRFMFGYSTGITLNKQTTKRKRSKIYKITNQKKTELQQQRHQYNGSKKYPSQRHKNKIKNKTNNEKQHTHTPHYKFQWIIDFQRIWLFRMAHLQLWNISCQ